MVLAVQISGPEYTRIQPHTIEHPKPQHNRINLSFLDWLGMHLHYFGRLLGLRFFLRIFLKYCHLRYFKHNGLHPGLHHILPILLIQLLYEIGRKLATALIHGTEGLHIIAIAHTDHRIDEVFEVVIVLGEGTVDAVADALAVVLDHLDDAAEEPVDHPGLGAAYIFRERDWLPVYFYTRPCYSQNSTPRYYLA